MPTFMPITAQPANGLNQQGKSVLLQRGLQTTHHRDLIFQATLQMNSPALLKIFRVVGRKGEIGHDAQFPQHQIEMIDG